MTGWIPAFCAARMKGNAPAVQLISVRASESSFFALRLSDQRFHRHRPIFEAEVRVAIYKHV